MFAIVGAEVHRVTRPVIAGGTVLVDKGKVSAVGKNVRVPKSAERIDAKGRPLTPGFVDAHSHAGLHEDGLPGDTDVNEKADPVTPHVRAIDAFRPTDAALLEAAQSGVSAAYITPGSANVVGGLGAVVKTVAARGDGQLVRPDAGLKLATGENPKRVHGEKDRMPTTRMGTAAVLRSALTKAVTYAERKRRHARKKGSKDPFEPDLAMEALAGLLAGDYPARCHAHRSTDMLTAMRIAEEFGFRLVFEHATECEDVLDELGGCGIPVVIGPTFGMRTKIELRRKSFAAVRAAIEAGLLVAITADTDVTPLRYLNVYGALAIREGLAADEALKALTLNPAKICGVDDRLGSIAVGKDADLVLWEGDPFDARTRTAAVWIDGEPVDLALQPFGRWS
jgi:imidazolonepropionase-like amidohydrolase